MTTDGVHSAPSVAISMCCCKRSAIGSTVHARPDKSAVDVRRARKGNEWEDWANICMEKRMMSEEEEAVDPVAMVHAES